MQNLINLISFNLLDINIKTCTHKKIKLNKILLHLFPTNEQQPLYTVLKIKS